VPVSDFSASAARSCFLQATEPFFNVSSGCFLDGLENLVLLDARERMAAVGCHQLAMPKRHPSSGHSSSPSGIRKSTDKLSGADMAGTVPLKQLLGVTARNGKYSGTRNIGNLTRLFQLDAKMRYFLGLVGRRGA
jgi:hypothetical protein